jgi:Na+-translocating ferredoxin:NAD+ oxidoreductase RnfG subunit
MRPVGSFFLSLLLALPVAGASGEQVLGSFAQAAQHFFPTADKLAPVELKLSAAQQTSLQVSLEAYRDKGGRMTWQRAYPLVAASSQGKALGVAIQIEEIGKHKLITFAVGVKPDGSVQGVEVLTYRENYGIQIRVEKFLTQYKGKRWMDKIATPGDIDAVSGATYSSYAANRAVRKALAVLRVAREAGGS